MKNKINIAFKGANETFPVSVTEEVWISHNSIEPKVIYDDSSSMFYAYCPENGKAVKIFPKFLASSSLFDLQFRLQ